MTLRSAALALSLLLVAGCGATPTTAEPDSGTPATDAGELVVDAGEADGGPTDGGGPDDGGLPDAGPIDGGAPDAGTLDGGGLPPVTCLPSAQADLFRDRSAGHTLAERGGLLACAFLGDKSQALVDAAASVQASGRHAKSGWSRFGIQYVSEGRTGTVRAGTATVLVPLFATPPAAGSLLTLVFAHGTSGMGPECGPTRNSVVADYGAEPLVAQGHVVVIPDYPGMGVDDGLSPYGSGETIAPQLIDALRALPHLTDARFDARWLDRKAMHLGHSQGGQNALFAHALHGTGSGFELLGSVSFAPGFGDIRNFASTFIGTRGTTSFDVYPLMALYGSMLANGGPAASTWLTATAQTTLPTMLHDQCLYLFSSTLPQQFPRLSSLYTAAFMQQLRACNFAGPCPNAEPWSTQLRRSVPGDFASTAPALLLHGANDDLVDAPSVACIRDRMAARGTPVAACTVPGADHFGVVNRGMGAALDWIDGRRTGTSPNVCAAAFTATCP